MWRGRRGETALTEALLNLLFASPCTVCEADDGPLCDACRAELSDCGLQCPRCAMTVGPYADLEGGCSVCRERSQGFDQAVALGPYQGPIRDICLELKHANKSWLARWMVDILMDVHGDRLRSFKADLVVPVPLHWQRQLKRGYNQARAIADRVARRLDLPLRHLLTRPASTRKLAGESRTARQELMKNAFRTVRGADLVGKTVILVDDILTTGATCGACARSLKKAGARRVIAVVLGRAEGSV